MSSRMRRATCLSSLRSCDSADRVYSIVQVKGFPHVGRGSHAFFAFSYPFQYISCKIIVFKIFKSALDEFLQVKCLCPASLDGEKINPPFSFWLKTYGCCHLYLRREILYSENHKAMKIKRTSCYQSLESGVNRFTDRPGIAWWGKPWIAGIVGICPLHG